LPFYGQSLTLTRCRLQLCLICRSNDVIRLGGKGRRQSFHLPFGFRYQVVNKRQALFLRLCVMLALFV